MDGEGVGVGACRCGGLGEVGVCGWEGGWLRMGVGV